MSTEQKVYQKVLRIASGVTLMCFLCGFVIGTQLDPAEFTALSPGELHTVEERFLASDLVAIRQASYESIEAAQLKIAMTKKEQANTYFAPEFGKHFWTRRGWAQRITCLSSPHFVRPLRSVMTSRYGRRKNPFGRYTKIHSGLDYRGVIGTPVQAAETGYVNFARRKGRYGNTIMLTHKNGFTTLYAHLDRFAVKPGARVIKGQTLGFVGDTGRVTGPHLHFEVRCNNVPVNPSVYLKKPGKRAVVAVMRPLYQPEKNKMKGLGAPVRQLASYKRNRSLKRKRVFMDSTALRELHSGAY